MQFVFIWTLKRILFCIRCLCPSVPSASSSAFVTLETSTALCLTSQKVPRSYCSWGLISSCSSTASEPASWETPGYQSISLIHSQSAGLHLDCSIKRSSQSPGFNQAWTYCLCLISASCVCWKKESWARCFLSPICARIVFPSPISIKTEGSTDILSTAFLILMLLMLESSVRRVDPFLLASLEQSSAWT